jgi:hypothetical protein
MFKLRRAYLLNDPKIIIPQWHPSFVHKPGDFVRLSATQIGLADERVCLDNFALKARPNSKVTNSYSPTNKEQFNTFPLGLVKDIFVACFNAKGFSLNSDEVMDFIEPEYSNFLKQSRAPVHQSTIKWVDDAIVGFAKAWDSARIEDEDIEFAQIIDPIYFEEANLPVEMFAWGIFLTNQDYSIREFRMLKMHSAGKSEVDTNRLNSIITILLDGQANSGIDFSTPTEKIPNIWPKPERIRIREIGVLDGSQKLIYDQLVNELELDNRQLLNLVEKRLNGGSQKVSTECLKCKANTVCPALPTKAGLLGVINRAERIKSFSPSKLNSYLRCNHAYFLQHELALHSIPKISTSAQERGMLIHQWIEHAHSRNIKCSKADLPSKNSLGPVAQHLGWSINQAEVTIEYLNQHLKVCPIINQGESIHEVDMWVMDSDAWVLVGTRPDLIYIDKKYLVWREIKTTDKKLDLSLDSYLDMFSQIPLAIVLMSRVKKLPNLPNNYNDLSERRVELEIITKDDAQVIKFDISDNSLTALAWQKLAQQADRWIIDKDFTPAQNAPCQWCAVSQWCEFADTDKRVVELDGVKVDLTTGEIVEQSDPLNQSQQVARALGLISAISEEAADTTEVPF